MGGFIILGDGRAYAASNWAYDATVRAIAEVLPDTPKGRALRDWLMDQRCGVQGPGLGSVDVRELTPESRDMFLKAAQDAFAVHQTRGPVGEGWTPEYWTGWLQRFADFVKMIELAGRGEPPVQFNPHMNDVIPATGERAGPGWNEQAGGTSDPEDWRLTNKETYLKGVPLCRKPYISPQPGWNHDHCEFCWAKFMEQEHPGVLHEGYATLDDERWICSKCFNDFCERFQWEVVEIDKLIADLSSDDGQVRIVATKAIFALAWNAYVPLIKAGAREVVLSEVTSSRRIDMVYSLLGGRLPASVGPMPKYLQDSFGLTVEKSCKQDDATKMGEKHGFSLSGVFMAESSPSCYVTLKPGKSLADVLKAILSEEPQVVSANLKYCKR